MFDTQSGSRKIILRDATRTFERSVRDQSCTLETENKVLRNEDIQYLFSFHG